MLNQKSFSKSSIIVILTKDYMTIIKYATQFSRLCSNQKLPFQSGRILIKIIYFLVKIRMIFHSEGYFRLKVKFMAISEDFNQL